MTAIASNLPNGRKIYVDANGTPIAGGTVTFYVVDTTELSTVYLDTAMTTAAENPLTLDSAGGCTLYAVGEFREYVKDVDGNLLSDAVVVASSPLRVSESMRPVLEAATPADAEAILEAAGTGGTHLEVKPGDQSLNISPTGNPPNTRSSVDIQGMTLNPNSREFLVHMGMESNAGQGGTLGNDKVALYTGMVAKAGTADVWSQNPLLTMEAGSGSYNAQTMEIDFNNFNADRGSNGNLQLDFTAPIACGLSVTGAGDKTSTSGVFVNSTVGAGHPQWARGITIAGTNSICGLQMWQSSPVGIQFDGQYSIAAINLTSAYINAGAITSTALFLKAGHTISWQSADAGHVVSDFFDNANNRYIGISSDPNIKPGIITGGITIPQVDAQFDLGSGTNRWKDVSAINMRLPNQGAITWQNNAANNGGIADLIFDYTDNLNNRIVGSHSQTVYMGGRTAPQTPNLDLGTVDNPWGTIYSSLGVVVPSDPALKTNTKTIECALDVVNQINPISFKWKTGDDRTHFGFNADQVNAALPGSAAYVEENGKKFISKDEMLAIAWQAIRELQAEVKTLRGGSEDRFSDLSLRPCNGEPPLHG